MGAHLPARVINFRLAIHVLTWHPLQGLKGVGYETENRQQLFTFFSAVLTLMVLLAGRANAQTSVFFDDFNYTSLD